MRDCFKCPYGGVDEFGDSWCNYFNINPAGICVYDIIEEENKEYHEGADKNEVSI